MTPVSALTPYRLPVFSLKAAPVKKIQAPENRSVTDSQQTPEVPPGSGFVDQLPPGVVQDVTGIFRSINILASQALEPGLGFETREDLQAEVDDEISGLTSVLHDLNRNDLVLFTAILQNPSPDNFSGSTTFNGNSVSDLISVEMSNDTLETLLNIEVTTESGALAALGFTNSIIETFTGYRKNSGLLETLLDELTRSIIDSALQERAAEDQAPEESPVSSVTQPFQDTGTGEIIAQIPPVSPLEFNPQASAHFVGYTAFPFLASYVSRDFRQMDMEN